MAHTITIWIENLATLLGMRGDIASDNNSKEKTGGFQDTEIIDRVWKSKADKQRGLVFLLKDKPDAFIVFWFEDTRNEFENWISSFGVKKMPLYQAVSIDPSKIKNKTVILLERYPLRKNEADLFSKWQARTIFILSSMEDPLFVQFGSQNIITLMEKIGMGKDEYIEHSMITQSIERAQNELEEKISVEQPAKSQEEWFKKNCKVS